MLLLLIAVGIAAVRLRDLFAVVMLFSIYSLLTALLFMNLDAVDVAFTEAAVGAGISSVLLLAGLRLVGRHEQAQRRRPGVALLVVCITGAALIYGLRDAPALGDASAPAQTHVATRYLQAQQETGVPNMVTAVLASYRGYDTLGETLVVFTAALGVLLLLGLSEAKPERQHGSLHDRIALRQVVQLLLPFIFLYALYVQFHGDYSAGGGFQAGVIFAGGLVIYDLIFQQAATRQVLAPSLLVRLAALGVLIYGLVGLTGMLLGRAFLDYSALSSDPIAGQHLGILLIELGVGLTVFSVISLIYFALSTRAPIE